MICEVIFYLQIKNRKIIPKFLGNSKPLTNFYVSARTIRNVHMPKNADAITLLKGQLDSMTRKNVKPTRRFKTSRAMKTTASTVQEAYKRNDEHK